MKVAWCGVMWRGIASGLRACNTYSKKKEGSLSILSDCLTVSLSRCLAVSLCGLNAIPEPGALVASYCRHAVVVFSCSYIYAS